jgi:secretion/DNA translocation related TadE-like protein
MRAGSDSGAGSLLGLAVVGSVVGVVAIVVPLYMAFVVQQSAAGAADASALAAADVAAGIAPGSPCAIARRVAVANHIAVVACDTDGTVVTVTVNRPFLGFAIESSATAGPADSVSN